MVSLLNTVLLALQALIFIDVILSWTMPPDRSPRRQLSQVTDPLYAPIRAVLKPERMGGLDLSPLILLLAISFMKRMLLQAASGGF
jgi:YggT family protein